MGKTENVIQYTPHNLTIWLRVVGKECYEEVHTQLYTLALIDVHGQPRVVKAVGMDSLSFISPAPGLIDAVDLFPEIEMSDMQRPEGEADLLIGLDNMSLHPESVVTRNELRLYKSQFGTGWVLAGLIPGDSQGDIHQSYHILTSPVQLPKNAVVVNTLGKIPGFFEAEHLSYAPRRTFVTVEHVKHVSLIVRTSHSRKGRLLYGWKPI